MCVLAAVRSTDRRDVISTAALHTGSANFNRRPTHGHIDGGATPGGRTELITKCRSSLAHPLYSTFEFNPLSSLSSLSPSPNPDSLTYILRRPRFPAGALHPYPDSGDGGLPSLHQQ